MLRHLLIFCLGFVFSFCAPRNCTPAEAAAISCSGAQYSCYIDAEEYQDGSSKNIPHCIKTFQKTWTVDTVNREYDHYHVYISGSTPLPLETVLDDKTPKIKAKSYKWQPKHKSEWRYGNDWRNCYDPKV